MTTLFWMFACFALVFGALIGSFLNVIIYRVPAGESIVFPASRCPDCGSEIRWYDNIPVVSWLVLGRECRDCGAPISAQYPLVEALTAGFSAALWFKVAHHHFQAAATLHQLPIAAIALPFLLYFTFLSLMVVIAFVDLEHYIIPHEFTLPGIVLGAATPWLFDWLIGPGELQGFWPPVTATESIVGILVGGFSILTIYFLYYAVRRVEGLGGGDVTLMALVGAWLGWPAILFIFFASSMQGTLAAGVAWLLGSGWLKPSDELFDEPDAPTPDDQPPDDPTPDSPEPADDRDDSGKLAVPFGPFIALSAVEHFFLGEFLPRMLSMAYLYDMWIP